MLFVLDFGAETTYTPTSWKNSTLGEILALTNDVASGMFYALAHVLLRHT